LMTATQEDILGVKGIGKAKIAQILAAVEIVKRQLRQPLAKINVIENPHDLFEYLRVSMSNLSREEFRVLHLNRSKHLIGEEVLFRGTVDEPASRAMVQGAFLIRSRPIMTIFALKISWNEVTKIYDKNIFKSPVKPNQGKNRGWSCCH